DGLHFLVMELVEGETLERLIPAGGLPLDRFFELAIPLTDAVAAAHDKGVVHRDLKPANVMVDGEGRVKVLDFGLAKLHPEAEGGEGLAELPTATLAQLTREGHLLGTVPYMSPEQVEGRAVDHRSDLFSLGVLLYEMATGRRPFAGENPAALVSSILRDDPPSISGLRPELPRHLGRILRHCLAKDVSSRLQSARDLRNQLQELRRELAEERTLARAEAGADAARPTRRGRPLALAAIGAALVAVALVAVWRAPWGGRGEGGEDAPVPTERQMIVVLPFENLGPPEHEYFAAGMTEEITSRLAAVEGLGVISRTSALQYGGGAKSIREIGDELGVDYVLEGTVRWAPAAEGPGRVRITPQLVRVRDDTHRWAGTFDGTLDDVVAVQSEIAGRVIGELQVAVAGRERQRLERGRPTEDSEAYQAYLRGQYRTDRWSLREAVADFESAVERDAAFAQAWAGLSRARSLLFLTAEDRSQESRDRALAAAERALEIDPDLAEGHLAVAYYHYLTARDYDRALESLDRARRGLPNDSDALSLLGFIQRRQGRWEESLATLRRALELDPRSSVLVGQVAMTHTWIRDFGEAIRLADQSLALDPRNTLILADKALARFEQTGDPRQGLAVLRDAPAEMDPMVRGEDFLLSIEAKLLVLAGEHGEALALLDRHDGSVYQHNLVNVVLPLELARGQVLQALGRDDEARAA
ncbi:MAG TPA: protein kinase, partial [Thermoanaerobaculia bacterium]|nr:protein kinase [Thermoanaerobaculia bacterium]